MYKTFVFATVIVAGVFLAPVATSAALAVPSSPAVVSTQSPVTDSGVAISSARLSVPGPSITRGVHAESDAGRTNLPPVQMLIVWSLLALIALTISLSVVRLLRRSEDDSSAPLSN
jgi:hypothetical protein